MIAVGYSKRVSNLLSKEIVPIKAQNDKIRRFARNAGLTIDRFYEDKSNDPWSDTGFQKLRVDGMNRRFDLVILDSVFRCGKNYAYARNLLYMTFYKIGIHFVILEDGINTMTMTADEVERYIREMKGKNAEALEYSLRQEKYQNDKTIPECRVRYGYFLNEDRTKLEIDEEAAKIVRLIFDMAASERKMVAIARELNRMKIETPSCYLHRTGVKNVASKRAEWTSETVRRLLLTEVYVGDDHLLQIDGTCYPQIIDSEVFNKARKIIRPNHIKRYKNHLLLKRRVFFCNTNEMLCYREQAIDGERYAYYHRAQDDVCVIEYDELLDALRIAFEREKRLADRLCRLKPDCKTPFIEEINDSYRERAQELFLLSLKAQSGNVELFSRYDHGEISQEEYDIAHNAIMQRQMEVNEMFHNLMEEKHRKIIYLGKDNPWAKRFMKYDSGMDLNCDIVNALVKRIEVYPDRKIIVFLNVEGKECVPERLLKEVRKDGT